MTIIIEGAPANTDTAAFLIENFFKDGTVTWTNQVTGFEALNIAEDTTENNWRPSSVPSNVIVDLGSAQSANCAGIAVHDMATSGASFLIQYSSDAVTWSDAIPAYAPLTDEDIMCFWEGVSARYWRFRLTGAVANVGVVFIGAKIVLPCSPLSGHKPLHHARSFEMLVSQTVAGQMVGNRVNARSAQTGLDFGLIDRDIAETTVLPLEDHYNNGGTFFYCGSPEDTPKDFGYCWRPNGADTMNITWEEGDGMAQLDFEVASYVSA